MIHTSRKITIDDKECIIDNPIILYRGDREIEVEFTIIGNRYTFHKDGNVIESTNASFGQLVILTPYGGRLFSDITKCEDGKVKLLIKKEMTNDLIEVGPYSMQIRLFDDNRIARITLPPINNGLNIREPIAAEEGSNVVGDAIVDASVIEDAKDYGDVDPFIGNQYNIKRWKAGDGITAPQMNKIERAIDTLNENRIIDERKLDQTMTTNNQQSNDINELKTDMNVVERRINTLTKLEDGSTTGDAELIDARIGYDSYEYDTLGDSMRQQITDVHHAIDLICGSNVKIELHWTDGGYIDKTDGNIVVYDNWKYTDYIELPENAKGLNTIFKGTAQTSYSAFYDLNNNFIEYFDLSNKNIDIPENAKFFRLSIKKDDSVVVYNRYDELNNKCNPDEVIAISSELDNKLIDDYIGLSKDAYDIKWIPDGYIDDKTGEMVYLDFNWKYTDYIKISENAKELEAVTTLTGSYSYNAFYDSNKVFISNFSVKNVRVEIPENAVYFRLSVDRASTTEICNVIEKLIDKCTIQEANELDNKLIDDYIGLSKDAYDIKWIPDGYIDDKTGEMVYLDFNWKYTDYIKISENAKELEAVTTLTGSYSYNAFYDSNKVFISNFSVKNVRVEIPENAVYFRLSVDRASTTEIYNAIEKLVDKCTIQEVSVFVEDKSDELLNMYIGHKYPIKWVPDGYIDNKTGEMVYLEFNWKYTDFINITNKTKYLDVYTTLTGSYNYNAFYDSNKTFISSFSVKDTHVKIPDNAAYFRLSVDRASTTVVYDSKYTGESENPINSSDIVYLNKDVEPFVIQASEGLGRQFPTKNAVLTFAHFSDIHTRQNLWDRIMKYVNHYSSYINFVIHTGDYVGANQASYADLYGSGITCVKPVYNVVGNHDTMDIDNVYKSDKAHVKSLLFNHMDNWNVTFMELDNSMTYYKDFDDSKIRMIVLDYYYDIDAQCTWLTERLNEAKNLGYHVVTFMHEMTHPIINKLDTTFQTIDDFESLGGNVYSKSKFDAVIGTWIQSGGVHIANFAGHEHSDFIGYTDNGVLNICVQTATNDTIWTDAKRVTGTKTYDCFNVVAIETTTGVLKLVRVGNNSDHYLREKKVFTYDYINKRIITK